MQTIDTLTTAELDALVRCLPYPYPKPKSWKRVDVGQIEVYVGDGLFVVTLVEKIADSENDLVSTQVNVEDVVAKYLRSEGFIGEEYAYIGMQKFDLKQSSGS